MQSSLLKHRSKPNRADSFATITSSLGMPILFKHKKGIQELNDKLL